MTRDDIIRLAREAGLAIAYAECDEDDWQELERFAALVAAAEREACAEVATNWRCNGMPRRVLGDAIRARGHVNELAESLTRFDDMLKENGIKWEVEP
jgi:hypothetical protein